MTLSDFNELLEGVDPDDVLAAAGLTQENVQVFAAWAVKHLIEERGIDGPEDLMAVVISAGVGLFAAGMVLQQRLDRDEDCEAEETPQPSASFASFVASMEARNGDET